MKCVQEISGICVHNVFKKYCDNPKCKAGYTPVMVVEHTVHSICRHNRYKEFCTECNQ